MQWHFQVSPADDGPGNMARDEALMRRAGRRAEAVFRVYSWSSPTLSLGRNQRARGGYDLDAVRRTAVGVVRRPTGGRALLHHREITYCVTMPAVSPAAARAAYDFINDVLLAGLRMLGVPAGRPAEPVAIPPGLRPCFDIPSAHEIALDGRKLVGSAQWRRDGALLQHGSILVRDDQPIIQQLLVGPGRVMAATTATTIRTATTATTATTAAATLNDALGRDPSVDEVAGHLRDALAAAIGSGPRELPAEDEVERDYASLRHSYSDDSWTWRR